MVTPPSPPQGCDFAGSLPDDSGNYGHHTGNQQLLASASDPESNGKPRGAKRQKDAASGPSSTDAEEKLTNWAERCKMLRTKRG